MDKVFNGAVVYAYLFAHHWFPKFQNSPWGKAEAHAMVELFNNIFKFSLSIVGLSLEALTRK